MAVLTCTPGYHLLKPVGGFTILHDGTNAIDWEDPEVQDKAREKWTSSSREAPARKDAVARCRCQKKGN